VRVDWDATSYEDRLPRKTINTQSKASLAREASLLKNFPPLNGVTASTPCIIVDMQGIIVTWYLPGILNDFRQVGVFT
jgi:hypothetical protein